MLTVVTARREPLTATLVLEDDDGGALAGTLRSEDGEERRFSGWMELAAAIEAWRAAPHRGGRA
jgi:hypothetical protein